MAPDSATEDRALPDLMSIAELADYLGVPVSTVYLWRSRGEGPSGFKIGKRVRYRAADVVKWLNEQQAAS
jgi:excisionase family DNA binding protein